jgi:hypothetical protein
MKEKDKKIVYWVLLVIFLPIAIYLLAIRSFLMFFVFAGVMSVLIKILKKSQAKQ